MKGKIIILVFLVLSSNSIAQNFKKSNEISVEQINSHITNFLKIERPALSFLSLNKISEERLDLDSKNRIYNVKYELLLSTTQDIIITDRSSHLTNKFSKNFSYTQQRPSGFDNFTSTGTYKLIKAGNRIKIEGGIQVDYLDGRLRFGTKGVENYQLKSKNYNLPNTVFANSTTQKTEKNVEQKIDMEEWGLDEKENNVETRKEIISNFPSNTDEFMAEYIVKVSDNFNARNEIKNQFGYAVSYAIDRMNRGKKVENDLGKSKAQYIFELDNVTFKKIGTNTTCSVKASLSVKYEFRTDKDRKYNFRILTRLPRDKEKIVSESDAWNDAYSQLRNKIYFRLMDIQPTELKISKLEVDKKGRIKYIYFEKPENFMSPTKFSIKIVDKNSYYENDGLTYDNKIGEIINKDKADNNLFKCKVKDKEFGKKLRENESRISEYIGITQKY